MHFMDKRMEERLPGTPAYREKKEKDMEKLDIYRINQQLQRIIRSLNLYEWVGNGSFDEAVKLVNRTISSSTVLNLSYLNNYENKEVATASLIFILKVLPLVEEEKRSRALHELQMPKNQLYRLGIHERQDIEVLEKKLRNR